VEADAPYTEDMRMSRTHHVVGRTRVIAAAAVVLAGLGAVGCESGNRVTMEDLELENQELRERNEQIERALNDCEDTRARLAAERDALLAENTELRGDLSDAAVRTGFEGVAGADVSMRAGEIAVSVAGDVLFDSGKVTLKNSAKQTLDRIANVIQSQYAGNEIRIAGHTDNDPIRKSGWKTNERLSAERALAVEEYLASQGISKDRMYIAGYGPAKPRGSKQESRRVEIVILRGS
jgi:chemotaxis protein MotB